MLEMQILQPHLKLIESEILGVGHAACIFTSTPGNSDAHCMLKFETHCRKWLSQDTPPGLIRWPGVLKREWQGSSNLEECLV